MLLKGKSSEIIFANEILTDNSISSSPKVATFF